MKRTEPDDQRSLAPVASHGRASTRCPRTAPILSLILSPSPPRPFLSNLILSLPSFSIAQFLSALSLSSRINCPSSPPRLAARCRRRPQPPLLRAPPRAPVLQDPPSVNSHAPRRASELRLRPGEAAPHRRAARGAATGYGGAATGTRRSGNELQPAPFFC